MSTSVTALAANFDINTLTSTGTFTVVTPTNAPASDTNYYIEVESINVGGNSRQIQRAYSMLDGSMSTRVYLAGTWTDWASGGGGEEEVVDNFAFLVDEPIMSLAPMQSAGNTFSEHNCDSATLNVQNGVENVSRISHRYKNVTLQTAASSNNRATAIAYYMGLTRNSGWRTRQRFAVYDLTASQRIYCGLISGSTSVIQNPTSATNLFGMFLDKSVDDDWQILHNDGSGVGTQAPVNGATGLTAADGQFFDFQTYCAKAGTAIDWKLTDLSTGAEITGSVSSDIPTNTPTGGQWLGLAVEAGNGATTDLAKVSFHLSQAQMLPPYVPPTFIGFGP